MDEILNKPVEELLVIVNAAGEDDKELLRAIAASKEVSFSGNTGVTKLKEKLVEALQAIVDDKGDDDDKQPVDDVQEDVKPQPGISLEMAKLLQGMGMPGEDEEIEIGRIIKPNKEEQELLNLNPQEIEDPIMRRQVIRAKALRLHRCRITNLDPSDADLPGQIFTVQNKYIGKVSKLVPYNEAAESYHLEHCLVEMLKSKRFPMRKEVNNKASQFGVKTRKTVWVPKFNIEILEPLTKEQVQELARRQAASGAIDNS